MKSVRIGEDEVKLSLFANDLTLHIENPKDSTKKLINGFSIQDSVYLQNKKLT